MNRNMSAPDKVYSVFKMGSASTDQHRRQARWQMSLLRHKSPYRTTLVPPSLILCIIKQQKLDLGQTWAHDCIYVMLEKNDKVFTSTPRPLGKDSPLWKDNDMRQFLEQSPLAQSYPFKSEKHSIWFGRMSLHQLCTCPMCLSCFHLI